MSLNNLGTCYEAKGDYGLAISFHQEALSIRQKSLGKTHPEVAYCLHSLGNCYREKGDYGLAISFHQEALSIRQKSLGKAHPNVAYSLNHLGACYEAKGDYSLAISYHREALAIFKKSLDKVHSSVANSLNNLGNCYYLKGDYGLAISFHQEALAIYKKKLGKTHLNVAMSLNNMGECYQAKGDYGLAISFHQEALSIFKKSLGKAHPYVANSLNNLGNCYEAKGDYGLAIACQQEALIALVPTFHSELIFQNPTLKAYSSGYFLLDVLDEKAKTFFDYYTTVQGQELKNLQAALSTIHLATALIADLRQNYKTKDSKHILAEKAAKTYNQAIKIALKTAEVYNELSEIPQHPEFTHIPYTLQGCKTLAFDFTEQSKAILLLSSLKDSKAKTTTNIPADLLKKEKQLSVELNYLDKNIAIQEAQGDEKNEELLSKLQSQHFDCKQKYDQLINQFEADYPEYYRLKYDIKTASVKEVQHYLQNNNKTIQKYSNSAIISYHTSPETIYIFTITANTYHIATVAKPEDFSDIIEDLQTAISIGHQELFVKTATSLFDLLLQPVWKHIEAAQNFLIIPHAELYYIPFDALLNQQQVGELDNFADLPYLIRDYNISYHYSATMLLHSHERGQATSEQADSFFGLAPIQFGDDNKAVAKPGYVVKSSEQKRKVVLKSSGDERAALQDLADTEAEVKEIYQQFERQGKEAIALFYDQANKENLQEYIGAYKYVLISTHGFLQEMGKKTLSGIHLAPPSPKTSLQAPPKFPSNIRQAPRESSSKIHKTSIESDQYTLHTSETYHLNLNADLVVLSSCESGIGKLKVGEGMMALNRGFLYVGAANIVYSLFKVPQDSTSQLTQYLFRYILKGMSYAKALRKAKLELIADEMMEPIDWAGFALIGR